MGNEHVGAHLAKSGAEVIKNLKPLGDPKSPVLAFIIGLLFGALGVAIYFKSAKDFFICLGMLVVLTIVLPGIGAIPGWLFSPCYGAWRAHTSNENLGV